MLEEGRKRRLRVQGVVDLEPNDEDDTRGYRYLRERVSPRFHTSPKESGMIRQEGREEEDRRLLREPCQPQDDAREDKVVESPETAPVKVDEEASHREECRG